MIDENHFASYLQCNGALETISPEKRGQFARQSAGYINSEVDCREAWLTSAAVKMLFEA